MSPIASESCKLVDNFAIIIQILMASIALCSLLYKRSFEHPKRPLLIWCMDTAKQAISASLIHFTNIFLSYLSVGIPQQSSNPCVWYFLNLLMDTTVGVYILYLSLLLVNYVASLCGITEIQMGWYGNPPSFYSWTKQLIIFLIAWFFVKVIVAVVVVYIPLFSTIAELIISPISDKRAQIVFVMFVFPLIMNIIQAWLVDKVIKAKIQHLEDGPVPVPITIDDDTMDGLMTETTNDSFDTCQSTERTEKKWSIIGLFKRKPLDYEPL